MDTGTTGRPVSPTHSRPGSLRGSGGFRFVLAAWAVLAQPGAAQDRFGSAVAITGPAEIVVLKPGAALGPAAAIVFRPGADGTWAQTTRLAKLEGGYPGESLLPSLTHGGDLLVLASGDPDGREAGHLYQRDGTTWTPRHRVPVDPAVGATAASLPSAGLDMPTLNRLMGPPARTVVLSPDGERLAVAGGAIDHDLVHVLRMESGAWVVESAVRLASGDDSSPGGPGTALALSDRHLLVGVPDQGHGGAVHLFERGEDGWVSTSVFPTDSLERDAGLGSAVALSDDGSEAFASAPGLERVLRFAPGGDGIWSRSGVVMPPERGAASSRGFGTALAMDSTRLVVGAPQADEGNGRVFVFERMVSGAWVGSQTLVPDLERAGFGSSLSVRGDAVVIGAPDAYGAVGRAAFVDLGSGDPPVWLDPSAELATVSGPEPVTCSEGQAAGYACEGVDLVSFLPLSALGAEPGERVTDVWGWADPETHREYVLIGRTAGLAFVDITNPGDPTFLGLMPANASHARDIKVYRNYAFMTGDGAGEHGLLVFDLTRLRSVPEVPATFAPDARYDEVASAHNLVIDPESGFAYTVGTNTGGQSCGGGLHMIDIRDPLQPIFAACYTDTEGLIWTGRTHDAQCTVYRGPDEAYQGRQICFAANETAMRIVDVTNKTAPEPISTASHPGTAYIHQGWLTEDQRYLYVNDELDEIVGTSDRTRTLIYDVAELDDPILIGEHLGPDRATDHNLYISGNRAYLANYQAGFRVLDVSDPERPVEIGWFDTTPYGENPPGFGGGAWTAWPFFDSGMIVVSSMNEGLFIVRPQRPVT